MNAQLNLYKLQMERFKVFESQDAIKGKFDVVFEIDGKKLYANKYVLCTISSTFESMLSERWMFTFDPIKIQDYSFKDFKEFLTFIYSGQCKLTNDNVYAMIEMAELYNIEIFKEICGEFLAKLQMNINNIYLLLDVAVKYSISNLQKSVNDFISKNLSFFLNSSKFQNLQKAAVKEIVKSNQNTSNQEEMFEIVYKWAENRIEKTTAISNMNDAIKEELTEILPFVNFEKMNYGFFVNFVLRKSLLPADRFCDILLKRNKFFVKIIDKNGKKMEGELFCDEINKIVAVIESLKNITCECGQNCHYWRTKQSKPSTPCKIIKKKIVEYFLVFDYDGDLAVKRRSLLSKDDYLLAELCSENGFQLCMNCKIEISRFA